MHAEYGALLDALRGLSWPARRPVRGARAGTHAARLTGSSPEFAEYRPYRQGEDPRRLDWKLLARTDRAYLRITTESATLPTVVIVDASASMAFPARSLGKWRHACMLTLGLLAVAQAAGDPVGVMIAAADGMRALAPSTRRGAVAQAVRVLDALTPSGREPLAPVLARAAAGARVVIISDLLGDAEAVRAHASQRLAAGAEVHVLHVVAEEELELEPALRLALDPEADLPPRAVSASGRAAYARAFAAWREEQARAWRGAGAAYHEVRTGEPAERAVHRIVRSVPAAEAG